MYSATALRLHFRQLYFGESGAKALRCGLLVTYSLYQVPQ